MDLEDIGPRRSDRHASLVSTVVANSQRDSKSRPQPYTFANFDIYPRDVEESLDETPEQLASKLLAQFRSATS